MLLVIAATPKYPNLGSTAEPVINKQDVHTAVSTVEAVEQPQPTEPTPEPVAIPEPEPTPVEQPLPQGSGDCSLAYNYDWPTDVAYAVCKAESGGNPNATNWTDNHGSCVGSYSLMQVGCFWYPYFGYSEADFYNPQTNMLIAYKIWQRQGNFRAWSAFNNGSYLRYM